MAKQMSTVELVKQTLESKGYSVDEVELSGGAITVAATDPTGAVLLESFKQGQARKWMAALPDFTQVEIDVEMDADEWERQYGGMTDTDVEQALAPTVEPAAVKVAPELKEEEAVKVYACEKCGVVLEDAARFCEPCGHKEEERTYEAFLAEKDEVLEEHPFLGTIFEAMVSRRWLVMRYETPQENGESAIRDRKLLPSHVYKASSTEGMCVVGYDDYRKEVRTFRLDRMLAAYLGEPVPAKNGDEKVTVYPAVYALRTAHPQRVADPGKYVGKGWSTVPLPLVLQ